ncbi:MAG TPA: hypothetical protein VIZ90_00335 [Rhizobiaceae bacterium]
MVSQTLDAEILDPRVLRCGVSIEGEGMKTIRPFIETASDLRGRIDIKVQSRSGSNANVSRQSVGFPGNNIIAVGRPASMRIEMTATSDGKQLCRLAKDIEFDEPGLRI